MSLLDVECLQKLSFERSKKWADFVESVVAEETFSDVDLTELEESYPVSEESDNNDELASMEEDVCDNKILDSNATENVTETTRLSLLLKNKALKTPDEQITAEENEMIEVFNQTLPIINEHNRQLKKYGLDKILISFDRKKIEEKVGSWLCRHNSLYGGDNTILWGMDKTRDVKKCKQLPAKSKILLPKCKENKKLFRQEAVTDSDDSLQSGETAKYIRSSKTNLVKKSALTSTIIKTYRKVKSTREALREKYACDSDDDDVYLESLVHRRRGYHSIYRQCDVAKIHKSCAYDITPLTTLREKRKFFRKRTCSDSCNTIDSSSDSDYCYKNDWNLQNRYLKTCWKHQCSNFKKIRTPYSEIKMSPAHIKRIYYYPISQRKSLSSPFSTATENRRIIMRNANNTVDNFPYEEETDCHFCNDSEFSHDTSSDEWIAENYSSPKKYPKLLPIEPKSNKSLTSESDGDEDFVTEIECDDMTKENNSKVNKNKHQLKTTSKKKCATEIATAPLLKHVKTTKVTYKIGSQKPVAYSITKKLSPLYEKGHNDLEDRQEDENLSDDAAFNCDLEMTIKASMEAYKKEQEMNAEAVKGEIKNEMTNKLQKNQKKREIVNVKSNNITYEFKPLRKIPANNKKTPNSNLSMQKNPKTNIKEDTFLSATQEIVNSTALPTDIHASNRQISYQLVTPDYKEETNGEEQINYMKKLRNRKQKSAVDKIRKKNAKSSTVSEDKREAEAVACISTEVSLNSTSKVAKVNEFKQKKEMTYVRNSDSKLVTSPTNAVPFFNKTANKKIENTHPNLSISTSSKTYLAQDAILIYDPANRNMMSSDCFTKDGYFIITKEHLSKAIGIKPAAKFLKYYIGRKQFKSDSTVYYKPPIKDMSSSDSDDDLENIGCYGHLYVTNEYNQAV